MSGKMIIKQARTSNGNEQTLHRIKDKMVERRGGKDGLSETKDGNDGQKADGMNGSRQNNRSHGKSNLTARWFDGRRIIKEQEQDVRRQNNSAAVGRESRNKVVTDCDNDEDNSQDREISRVGKNSMETRSRVRVEEDAETKERRTMERKGKSVAKEERTEEVYEIWDNTEEEEEMYELDREVGN